MKIFAFGAAAIFVCGSTFAQTENFTGFSSAVGLKRVDTSYYADILGSASYSADIHASYGVSLSKDVVLNFGASLGLGSSKIVGYNIVNDIFNLKLKNPTSIYIEPGFRVSNQTLFYGKISHDSAKFSASETISGENTVSSFTNQGLGLGIGIRTMMNDKMFAQFEIKKTNYSSRSTVNGIYLFELGNRYNSTSGSIAIGYKF